MNGVILKCNSFFVKTLVSLFSFESSIKRRAQLNLPKEDPDFSTGIDNFVYNELKQFGKLFNQRTIQFFEYSFILLLLIALKFFIYIFFFLFVYYYLNPTKVLDLPIQNSIYFESANTTTTTHFNVLVLYVFSSQLIFYFLIWNRIYIFITKNKMKNNHGYFLLLLLF